jgi:lipoprotein-anchoring transpeptidase ErfK/SrfK
MDDDKLKIEDSESGIGGMVNEADSSAIEKRDTLWQKFLSDEKPYRILRRFTIAIALIASVVLLFAFVVFFVPVLQEKTSVQKPKLTDNENIRKDANYKKTMSLMAKDVQRLSSKYNSYTSGQSYVVINTIQNKFMLYKNKQLIRKGSCSSGSYTRLQGEGNKHWIFKTPRGKYSIKGKVTDPVWIRPDWAFVEEGLPIPSKNDDSRYEYGVLGDYALALGDGYMIHGTIYKRFLGMPVTHGCVRLNDDDLKVIYNTLNIGSKVYIF